MRKARLMVSGFLVAGFAGLLMACSAGSAGPTGPAELAARGPDDGGAASGGSGAAGNLRLRCEARAGRSKISVDGKNLSPRNGTFRARVKAGDVTIESGTATAIGDEVEFDFDSNRDDIARGATPIPPNFVVPRSGFDVEAQILNSQGQAVASAGAECEFR